MKIIIILNDKPIYTANDLVDWWTVAKIVERDLNIIDPLSDKHLDEWIDCSKLKGSTLSEFLKAYDVKVWKWNEVARDWYLQ